MLIKLLKVFISRSKISEFTYILQYVTNVNSYMLHMETIYMLHL